MTDEQFITKRDSICNSLSFLTSECGDGDDPFFLMVAAMLLNVTSALKLTEPEHAKRMMDVMIGVSLWAERLQVQSEIIKLMQGERDGQV